MNARFLHTFRLTAETGSMAAAGRQLGLSSTSVGEQIRALESDIGARLVHRQGRGIALTEAGQAILPSVRDVLERIDELRQVAQLGRLRGLVRVGAIGTAIISVLPPALRHMALHCPGVDLLVYPGSSIHLYERLERGELDCAITGRPRFSLPKSMTWHPVRDEPLVLLCPDGMDVPSAEATIGAEPFIRMDRTSWTGQIVTRLLENRAARTRELFEMDAPEALVILVAQGVGVTLLPDWGIAAPAGSDLKRLAVGGRAYDRQLGVIGLQGPRTRLVNGFVEALRAGTGTVAGPPAGASGSCGRETAARP